MAVPKPPGCQGCPAATLGTGFVPPEGPVGAEGAIIGQGPGQVEAYSGVPFSGPTGHKLNLWLVKAKLHRHRLRIANVVQCWLPKNRPPTAAETSHCWDAHLQPLLAEMDNLRVVVPVGVPAIKTFLGPAAGETTAGTIVEVTRDALLKVSEPVSKPIPQPGPVPEVRGGPPPGGPQPHQDHGVDVPSGSSTGSSSVYVSPILHPSYIIKGKWALEPAQVTYLRRIAKILAGDRPTIPDVAAYPPSLTIPAVPDQLDEWLEGLPPPGEGDRRLAADIEGIGNVLIGIGFCRFEDEATIYVPFRRTGGELYWTDPKSQRRAVEWLDRVLSDPTIGKVFHNGNTFDIPFLEQFGFEVGGFVDDTMVGQAYIYAEMPKRLEFLGTLWAGLPSWKYLSKVGEEGDDK